MTPLAKKAIISSLLLLYIIAGLTFHTLVKKGIISKKNLPIKDAAGEIVELMPKGVLQRLTLAQEFVNTKLTEPTGHVKLYYLANKSSVYEKQNSTNSEAMSYYLLWTAQAKDKNAFDRALNYIEKY